MRFIFVLLIFAALIGSFAQVNAGKIDHHLEQLK
jgi:hypothetical protein